MPLVYVVLTLIFLGLVVAPLLHAQTPKLPDAPHPALLKVYSLDANTGFKYNIVKHEWEFDPSLGLSYRLHYDRVRLSVGYSYTVPIDYDTKKTYGITFGARFKLFDWGKPQ